MPIAYNPGQIQSMLAQVMGQKNSFNEAGNGISQAYKALDATSEGAAAQAQAEYQSKQAVSRQKLEEVVQALVQATQGATDQAQATDNKYAASAQ